MIAKLGLVTVAAALDVVLPWWSPIVFSFGFEGREEVSRMKNKGIVYSVPVTCQPA